MHSTIDGGGIQFCTIVFATGLDTFTSPFPCCIHMYEVNSIKKKLGINIFRFLYTLKYFATLKPMVYVIDNWKSMDWIKWKVKKEILFVFMPFLSLNLIPIWLIMKWVTSQDHGQWGKFVKKFTIETHCHSLNSKF